ncbi:hypothetical protein CAMRE0001_2308 [Campylobacter rectus RM3267]|uniref:Uncharacterized protein n=1 Tax=Campylobacter rectus RM3267 TaxID=553218 RepID=B9D5F2_CAMRE|nr:hypothetical protein CAMRE0001_2308 [Campylobacter rectus RM3267]
MATGVTSSVMTEPNLKITKYRAKRQAAISRDGFLLRYARNAKARKGFASLAVATASRSEVKI